MRPSSPWPKRVAFDQLYQRHALTAYNVAWVILQNESEAEEAVQETFMSVHQYIHTFRGDSKFSTWLYRVTTNCALMRLRKRQPEPVGGLSDLEGYEKASSSPKTPQGFLEEQESMTILERALSRLEPEARAMLVARCVNDSSHEELAAQFGCTIGAAKSRLHKARLQVCEDLERMDVL